MATSGAADASLISMSADDDNDDDNDDIASLSPLSYANFDRAPGVAMRIFYSADSGTLDAVGDAELRALHTDAPFAPTFDTARYIELVSRPFVLCKRVGGTSYTQFAFTRPPRRRDSAQPLVPFDPLADAASPPIVLFDDAKLVPLLVGRVSEFDIRPRAASGTFTFTASE